MGGKPRSRTRLDAIAFATAMQGLVRLHGFGRYRTISADPPWPARDQGSRMAPNYEGTGRAYSIYRTMTMDRIAAMGEFVKPCAHDDSFLFLWAPHYLVITGEAGQIAKAWGFTPKQEIVWHKTDKSGKSRIGGGHYARLCTEAMLLCRRGRAQRLRADIPNHFSAPRPRHHSGKPDKSYQIIEDLARGPYLELFARRRYSQAWSVWGDQAPSGEPS